MAKTQAQRALLLAIAIERHNAKKFREWSMRFSPYDIGLTLLLEELAKEEGDHELELADLYQKIFSVEIPATIDVPDELSQYDIGLEKIKQHYFVVNPVMAHTLLEMALEIESYTREYYSGLITNETNLELVSMYNRLASFEADHEQLFNERIEFEKNKVSKQLNSA
ncbi:MAG: hypothetical protein ACE5EH_07635 [Gammaproteobacteria bacterium]